MNKWMVALAIILVAISLTLVITAKTKEEKTKEKLDKILKQDSEITKVEKSKEIDELCFFKEGDKDKEKCKKLKVDEDWINDLEFKKDKGDTTTNDIIVIGFD